MKKTVDKDQVTLFQSGLIVLKQKKYICRLQPSLQL
jgi:hypothetical protein